MLAAARILQDELSQKESAIQYLDQTGQLASIKQKCVDSQKNNEKQGQIYSFCISIDLPELCEVSAELGNLVVHQPSEALAIFHEVCFTTVKTLGVVPDSIKATQIHVNIRLKDLPELPSYILQPRDFFGSKFTSRFYKFVGIVCSMTTSTEYSHCAKYRCPVSGCQGSADNVYVRLHTAGSKETQTVRKDFHCMYCGTLLVEDVNCRVLGEKCVVKMVAKDAFSSSAQQLGQSSYHQSITVFVRDDLIPRIFLGGCFNVIGIPVMEYLSGARVSVAVEANNISLIDAPLIAGPCKSLPLSIGVLYSDRKSSPWSFSASLAYLFASDIAPAGTFHKLKFHLLLSLVQSSDPSNLVDLLAVTKETSIVHRLMMHAASFADRHVVHSSGIPLFGSVQKDPHTGACNIDAGSIILAHHGVCLLGDMGSWKKEPREKLRTAAETRCITLDIPHHVEVGPLQSVSVPMQSTMWAYISPSGRRPKQTDLFKAQDIDSCAKAMPEGFSLIVSCDNSDQSWDDFKEACLIHRTLIGSLDAQSQDAGYVISTDEFKEFIHHARQQSVVLTKAAQQLIKGYFVSSRRVRSSGVRGTPFPPIAVKTLTSMASAHAKLCLHPEVSEEDAVLAIMLYEESITARYGYSTLSVHPMPHFRDNNIASYLGPENDTYMQQFQQRLLRFCASHDPDFGMRLSED